MLERPSSQPCPDPRFGPPLRHPPRLRKAVPKENVLAATTTAATKATQTTSSDSDDDIASTLSSDQCFAYTLKNLFADASNVNSVVNKEAVSECVALARAILPDDSRTRSYCMSVFYSLALNVTTRSLLIAESGMTANLKLLSGWERRVPKFQ